MSRCPHAHSAVRDRPGSRPADRHRAPITASVRRLATIAGLTLACLAAHAAFTVDGRRLLQEGQPFQARGVAYQPTPVGDDPAAAPPNGDYYTATYAGLNERNLPLLRQLGANVIRVYGWNPAVDHKAFLDACYNGGESPIYVLVNRWIDPNSAWSNNAVVDAIRREFLMLESGLADHPAVLAVILGNEANAQNGSNPAFWDAMNSIAASIKQQNPQRLVSVAITDAVQQVAARDAAMSALDFWCVQVYRGTTFGTLFTEYAAASRRPLLVSEFGIDAFDQLSGRPYPDNGAFVGTVVANLWREIAANRETCAGGCVFAFSDEWWKDTRGSATQHETGGVRLAGLPDGFANEEWWGLYAIEKNGAALDTITPRAAVAALQALWTANAPVTGARLVNLSARVQVGGVAGVPIAGFVLAGAGTKKLLVRAIGPGLNAFGITNPLTDPSISVLSGQNVVTTNDNWSGGDSATFTATGAFGLAAGSRDAALVSRLSAGAYSTLVGTGGGSGVTLLEIYDADSANTAGTLVNLSTRAFVGTGQAVLIPGFTISGDGSLQLLIRAVGPALGAFGISGFLVDPRLSLHSGLSTLGGNDDWSDAANAGEIASVAARVGAFPFAGDSRDAALLVTLPVGAYSVTVCGVGNTTGVALVEIYVVP